MNPPSLTGSGVFSSYLRHLRDIPFVRRADVRTKVARDVYPEPDGVLVIKTPVGTKHFCVELKRTHLTREIVDSFVERTRTSRESWILFARLVGRPLGERMVASGQNFVDERGNLYLNIHDKLVARTQGRTVPRAERVQRGHGVRAAGYQALFTLLAEPSLLNASVRAIATHGGVSRQTVNDMRHRLIDEGYLTRRRNHYEWIVSRRVRLVEFWLAGYAATLRPALLVGSYRTKHDDVGALEAWIAERLRTEPMWRWGGAAAGNRLVGHYRGQTTTIHMVEPPSNLEERLQALRDPRGPLVILRAPGPISLEGDHRECVHPLLVYAELMASIDDRAHDLAHLLRERVLEVQWAR